MLKGLSVLIPLTGISVGGDEEMSAATIESKMTGTRPTIDEGPPFCYICIYQYEIPDGIIRHLRRYPVYCRHPDPD